MALMCGLLIPEEQDIAADTPLWTPLSMLVFLFWMLLFYRSSFLNNDIIIFK